MIVNKIENTRLLKYWLLSLISLVILMIVIGGLTRLTGSGLSITQWELFSGLLPPLNINEWEIYFNLYKEIPQYKLINSNMSLSEFKIIFFWEYIHRMLGRLIGLAFILPFGYFILKSVISKAQTKLFLGIFSLILFQGFVGWYMVESGLTNNVSVSHYRLSLHLTLAFIILTCLIWNYLNLISGNNKFFFSSFFAFDYYKTILFLLFIQVILGAFVSGLDAGKIYQTWPLMGDSFFPNDFIISKITDVFNFNSHSWVQFLHRINAYIILLIILILGYKIIKNKKNDLLKSYHFVLAGIIIQSLLGIITLISNLNMTIASLHQVSSIFLVIVSINLYYKSLN
jgi:cytochrome c oxidase assembly protein subunit 15